MSDTRTNAGIDNISMFKKMVTWEVPGERVITLMSAGNLATTQATISLLEERTKAPEDREPSIIDAPSMFQTARIAGETLREVIRDNADTGEEASSQFSASLILGGQIKGAPPRLFMIYPEGNFIEAGEDTPFLQIGETKYGKPILVRAYDPDMTYEDAIKLMMVSFDSTIKANLSVGPPLDLHVYEKDSLKSGITRRIEANDPYFRDLSSGWSEALRSAFASLPPFKF